MIKMESLSVLLLFLAVFSTVRLSQATSVSKLPGMLFPRDSESRQVKDLSGSGTSGLICQQTETPALNNSGMLNLFGR